LQAASMVSTRKIDGLYLILAHNYVVVGSKIDRR
jgi:hypothetical protein